MSPKCPPAPKQSYTSTCACMHALHRSVRETHGPLYDFFESRHPCHTVNKGVAEHDLNKELEWITFESTDFLKEGINDRLLDVNGPCAYFNTANVQKMLRETSVGAEALVCPNLGHLVRGLFLEDCSLFYEYTAKLIDCELYVDSCKNCSLKGEFGKMHDANYQERANKLRASDCAVYFMLSPNRAHTHVC